MHSELTEATSFIGKAVAVEIDRPLGSRHPKFGFIYTVNYGYLPGTLAPDDEPLDVYILGVNHPCERFAGQCIAVIRRLDDADDKLVVAPPGISLSDTQIRAATHFQEQWFTSIILR